MTAIDGCAPPQDAFAMRSSVPKTITPNRYPHLSDRLRGLPGLGADSRKAAIDQVPCHVSCNVADMNQDFRSDTLSERGCV